MEFKKIVFMTAFPNRDEDSSTILVYGINEMNHHILIWTPKAVALNCSMYLEAEDWEVRRKFSINGTTYTVDDELVKIIDLDFQKRISKSDIEKMFDCEVVE